METRTERFAKYRRNIRLMSDADFAKHSLTNEEKEQMQKAVSPSEAALAVSRQVEEGHKNIPNANSNFLARRRRIFICQCVVLGILVVVFLVWGILLFGRKIG